MPLSSLVFRNPVSTRSRATATTIQAPNSSHPFQASGPTDILAGRVVVQPRYLTHYPSSTGHIITIWQDKIGKWKATVTDPIAKGTPIINGIPARDIDVFIDPSIDDPIRYLQEGQASGDPYRAFFHQTGPEPIVTIGRHTRGIQGGANKLNRADYIKGIKNGKLWGGQLEMAIFERLFNRQIYIQIAETGRWQNINGGEVNFATNPPPGNAVFIQYVNGNHYNTFADRDRNVVRVIPGDGNCLFNALITNAQTMGNPLQIPNQPAIPNQADLRAAIATELNAADPGLINAQIAAITDGNTFRAVIQKLHLGRLISPPVIQPRDIPENVDGLFREVADLQYVIDGIDLFTDIRPDENRIPCLFVGDTTNGKSTMIDYLSGVDFARYEFRINSKTGEIRNKNGQLVNHRGVIQDPTPYQFNSAGRRLDGSGNATDAAVWRVQKRLVAVNPDGSIRTDIPAEIGSGLRSQTSRPKTFALDGHPIVLVDFPGFRDSGGPLNSVLHTLNRKSLLAKFPNSGMKVFLVIRSSALQDSTFALYAQAIRAQLDAIHDQLGIPRNEITIVLNRDDDCELDDARDFLDGNRELFLSSDGATLPELNPLVWVDVTDRDGHAQALAEIDTTQLLALPTELGNNLSDREYATIDTHLTTITQAIQRQLVAQRPFTNNMIVRLAKTYRVLCEFEVRIDHEMVYRQVNAIRQQIAQFFTKLDTLARDFADPNSFPAFLQLVNFAPFFNDEPFELETKVREIIDSVLEKMKTDWVDRNYVALKQLFDWVYQFSQANLMVDSPAFREDGYKADIMEAIQTAVMGELDVLLQSFLGANGLFRLFPEIARNILPGIGRDGHPLTSATQFAPLLPNRKDNTPLGNEINRSLTQLKRYEDQYKHPELGDLSEVTDFPIQAPFLHNFRQQFLEIELIRIIGGAIFEIVDKEIDNETVLLTQIKGKIDSFGIPILQLAEYLEQAYANLGAQPTNPARQWLLERLRDDFALDLIQDGHWIGVPPTQLQKTKQAVAQALLERSLNLLFVDVDKILSPTPAGISPLEMEFQTVFTADTITPPHTLAMAGELRTMYLSTEADPLRNALTTLLDDWPVAIPGPNGSYPTKREIAATLHRLEHFTALYRGQVPVSQFAPIVDLLSRAHAVIFAPNAIVPAGTQNQFVTRLNTIRESILNLVIRQLTPTIDQMMGVILADVQNNLTTDIDTFVLADTRTIYGNFRQLSRSLPRDVRTHFRLGIDHSPSNNQFDRVEVLLNLLTRRTLDRIRDAYDTLNYFEKCPHQTPLFDKLDHVKKLEFLQENYHKNIEYTIQRLQAVGLDVTDPHFIHIQRLIHAYGNPYTVNSSFTADTAYINVREGAAFRELLRFLLAVHPVVHNLHWLFLISGSFYLDSTCHHQVNGNGGNVSIFHSGTGRIHGSDTAVLSVSGTAGADRVIPPALRQPGTNGQDGGDATRSGNIVIHGTTDPTSMNGWFAANGANGGIPEYGEAGAPGVDATPGRDDRSDYPDIIRGGPATGNPNGGNGGNGGNPGLGSLAGQFTINGARYGGQDGKNGEIKNHPDRLDNAGPGGAAGRGAPGGERLKYGSECVDGGHVVTHEDDGAYADVAAGAPGPAGTPVEHQPNTPLPAIQVVDRENPNPGQRTTYEVVLDEADPTGAPYYVGPNVNFY